jgi:hypothetical protein
MLQPSGSDVPETEPAAPARLKSDAREGISLTIDPDWRVGRKLEAAREQRGLSLEQVAAQTRVRREFIEALEEMNAKLLPGKAYALAYLKSPTSSSARWRCPARTRPRKCAIRNPARAAPPVRGCRRWVLG